MTDYIIGGVILLAIVVSVIVSIVRVIKKAKIRAEEKTREVDGVVIKKGVRYTPKATIIKKEDQEVRYIIDGNIEKIYTEKVDDFLNHWISLN